MPGSVPLPSQDYSPVMRYSKGSKVRRILYTTYYTKNPENVDIFEKNEIMLRDLKMHAQLGHSTSYAAYRLERLLAKSSR